MFKKFVKYQSLGNDLVVVDLYKDTSDCIAEMIADTAWSSSVVRLCDRHYGIGADGIILLSRNDVYNMPEIHIFNADGTQAENCLNGTRSVAHYLHATHIPRSSFQMKVGSRIVLCEVDRAEQVTTHVGSAMCTGSCEISIPAGKFTGYVVSVGNPHFVIFEQTTLEWLLLHGKSIESHEIFPQKTNVEFVWKSSEKPLEPVYNMVVYERGSGPTLACGSGAAALVGLLFSQQQIAPFQKIVIKMPGGSLVSWIGVDGQIVQQAEARPIFRGELD